MPLPMHVGRAEGERFERLYTALPWAPQVTQTQIFDVIFFVTSRNLLISICFHLITSIYFLYCIP